MEKLTEVLTMGGYGQYVWPSYLTAGIILAVMALLSFRGLSRAKTRLGRLEAAANEADTGLTQGQ